MGIVLLKCIAIFLDRATTTDTQPRTTTDPALTTETATELPQSTVSPLVITLNSQRAGEDYTLTCQVAGGGTRTPTYQWFKDGAQLTDQTSETLSLSPLMETDCGVYQCKVTWGNMTSASVNNIINAGMCTTKTLG